MMQFGQCRPRPSVRIAAVSALLVVSSLAGRAPSARADTACPVTIPNYSPMPPGGGSGIGPEPTPTHGNGQLWTLLTPDGVVVVPENAVRDGWIGLKFPWARRVVGTKVVDGALTAVFAGELEIEARRLDALAPSVRVQTNPQGVHVGSGIDFPSPGCWEVTGRAGADSLTFVFLLLIEGQPLPTTAMEPPHAPWVPVGIVLLAASLAMAARQRRA